MWGPPEQSLLHHRPDPTLSCSVARAVSFPVHFQSINYQIVTQTPAPVAKNPSSQQAGAPPSRGFTGTRSIPASPSSSRPFLPNTGDTFYRLKGHKYFPRLFPSLRKWGKSLPSPAANEQQRGGQSPGLPQPCRRSSPTRVRAGCSSGAGAGRINKVRLCRPGLWPLLTQSTFRSGRNELYQPPPGRADGWGWLGLPARPAPAGVSGWGCELAPLPWAGRGGDGGSIPPGTLSSEAVPCRGDATARGI